MRDHGITVKADSDARPLAYRLIDRKLMAQGEDLERERHPAAENVEEPAKHREML